VAGPVTTNTPKRSWKRVALRLGGSAIALALLLRMLPLGQLWTTMRRLPPWVFAVTLVAYMTTHAVASMKWRMMVNTAGAGLGYRPALRCYFAGLFGNVFLPSIVGGDVIRAGLAMASARPRAGALLASLVDRMLDVMALGLVAGFGALMLPQALEAQSRRVFLALAAVAALLGLGGVLLVALFPARRFSFRKRRKLVRLRQAVRAMRQRPRRVAAVLALAIVLQSTFALLNAWIARWCGVEVPLYVWLFVWTLGKVSAMLPITQGGIGVREAALAALLVPFGVPPVLTVAAGLMWQVVIVAGGLCGGAIALAVGRPAAPVKREDTHAVQG